MESVEILIFSGWTKEPPEVVADPGCKTQEPAAQLVPAMAAGLPFQEMHIRLAELFMRTTPRVLLLIPDMVCAVPPVAMVPEQSVAKAGPATKNRTAASTAQAIRIMSLPSAQ